MSRAPDGTNYVLRGPETAPLVALIHGLGLNHAMWENTAAALSPDFRVLTYDLLGHGKSPAPASRPDLALLARQLVDLLDHISVERASIVGFSLGGMIARRFAMDFPDRCRAMAILHSPHRRSAEAQAAVLDRATQARKAGPAATVEAALVRWFTDDFRRASPETIDNVRRWVVANDPKSYPLFYDVFATGIDEILAPDPPITCPTLVITGDQDHGNGPEMARAIAAEISAAETVILPGLRHMALMEDPVSTNLPLANFLTRTLPNG